MTTRRRFPPRRPVPSRPLLCPSRFPTNSTWARDSGESERGAAVRQKQQERRLTRPGTGAALASIVACRLPLDSAGVTLYAAPPIPMGPRLPRLCKPRVSLWLAAPSRAHGPVAAGAPVGQPGSWRTSAPALRACRLSGRHLHQQGAAMRTSLCRRSSYSFRQRGVGLVLALTLALGTKVAVVAFAALPPRPCRDWAHRVARVDIHCGRDSGNRSVANSLLHLLPGRWGPCLQYVSAPRRRPHLLHSAEDRVAVLRDAQQDLCKPVFGLESAEVLKG